MATAIFVCGLCHASGSHKRKPPSFRNEIGTKDQGSGKSWRGHCDPSNGICYQACAPTSMQQPLANNGLKAKIG